MKHIIDQSDCSITFIDMPEGHYEAGDVIHKPHEHPECPECEEYIRQEGLKKGIRIC